MGLGKLYIPDIPIKSACGTPPTAEDQLASECAIVTSRSADADSARVRFEAPDLAEALPVVFRFFTREADDDDLPALPRLFTRCHLPRRDGAVGVHTFPNRTHLLQGLVRLHLTFA